MSQVSWFNEQPMTAREVAIARESFVAGATWADGGSTAARLFTINVVSESAARYPMPMVDVPRVLLDEVGVEWRIGKRGWVESRHVGGTWTTTLPMVDLERYKVITSLFTTPTVSVPADEATP